MIGVYVVLKGVEQPASKLPGNVTDQIPPENMSKISFDQFFGLCGIFLATHCAAIYIYNVGVNSYFLQCYSHVLSNAW